VNPVPDPSLPDRIAISHYICVCKGQLSNTIEVFRIGSGYIGDRVSLSRQSMFSSGCNEE